MDELKSRRRTSVCVCVYVRGRTEVTRDALRRCGNDIATDTHATNTHTRRRRDVGYPTHTNQLKKKPTLRVCTELNRSVDYALNMYYAGRCWQCVEFAGSSGPIKVTDIVPENVRVPLARTRMCEVGVLKCATMDHLAPARACHLYGYLSDYRCIYVCMCVCARLCAHGVRGWCR